MDYKIYKFLIVFYLVALVSKWLIELVQELNLPISDELIRGVMIGAFLIIWITKDLQQKKKIRDHSKLDKGERKSLKKLLRSSESYKKNARVLITFIVVWILISIACIFFFTNVLAEWRHTGWECVKVLAIAFGILGVFILLIGIVPDLKNSFPDIEKIFKKYNFEEIGGNENSLENNETQNIKLKSIIPQKRFDGKLQNNSKIVYELKILFDEIKVRHPGKSSSTTYNENSVSIAIDIDMTEILKNNNFDLSNESEIRKRFNDYFSAKEIISEDDILLYAEGTFFIVLHKNFGMNALLICEYLIAVINACQELEDIYNFPFEPTNKSDKTNT